MSGERVLVVDDSDTARTLLTRTLERAGFTVAAASDGAAGALMALRELPSVVVTDLDMPVMDGHQLLRLLKSEPATAATPVVILTSHGEAPSRFWGLTIGADVYLTKDCDPAELVATVARLASRGPEAERPGSAAELGPLEVLGRVLRQLDSSLLHATLVNALLERSIGATDLHAASQEILDVAGRVADASLLAIGVTEPNAATLHVHVAHAVSLAAAERFVSAVLAKMDLDPRIIPDVVLTGVAEGDGDADSGDIVSFPLPLPGASGLLALLPSEPPQFELTSRHLIQGLTTHAGLVLDNARLGQRLQELSTLDGLTRLLNHRAIHERLAHELERADRHGRNVAVVICDLDFFKRVNDTHGHVAGDTVLCAAAAAMTHVLRISDACGRYGGEEFLIVLPETDLEAARHVAERLRCAVADHPAALASGASVPLTASFGVASHAELEAGATADTLVTLADSRLYEAKAAGRNCVRP